MIAQKSLATFLLPLIALLALPAQAGVSLLKPDQPGRVHVLAVGVNDYPGQSRLLSAVQDAERVAKALPGAETTVLLNAAADKQGLATAFAALAAKTRTNDTVIVYLTGQSAVQTPSEQFVFLPGNLTLPAAVTEAELISHGIAAAQIAGWMQALPTQQRLLVADLSYGTVLGRVVAAASDATVLTAAGPVMEVSTGGVFTRAFLAALSATETNGIATPLQVAAHMERTLTGTLDVELLVGRDGSGWSLTKPAAAPAR